MNALKFCTDAIFDIPQCRPLKPVSVIRKLDFFSAPAILSFCERAIDGFPKYPAETWTNIGPFLAGLWIWSAARRDRVPQLLPLGVTAMVLALSSASFHATGKRWGEILDLAAMYVYVACLFWFAWLRLPNLSKPLGVVVSITIFTSGISAAVMWPELQWLGMKR